MTGEYAIAGVLVPPLLILGIIASLCTMALMRLADHAGFYRFVTCRAIVDVALYVIVFGLVALLAPHLGLAP